MATNYLTLYNLVVGAEDYPATFTAFLTQLTADMAAVDTTQYATQVLTFSAVAATADGTALNWAHGLGTDNIEFGFTLRSSLNAATNEISAVVTSVNRSFVAYIPGTPPADPTPSGTLPPSGSLRVNVRNLSVTPQDIIVNIWARTRPA